MFSSPTLGNNGNQLTLSDTNSGISAAGSWTYVLRVNVGGTVYTSKTMSLAATTTNPIIINK